MADYFSLAQYQNFDWLSNSKRISQMI